MHFRDAAHHRQQSIAAVIGIPHPTGAHGNGHTAASFETIVDVVATQDLPRSAAHPFYMRVNQVFDKGLRRARRFCRPGCCITDMTTNQATGPFKTDA